MPIKKQTTEPEIQAREYAARRKALLKQLPKNSIAIIPAAAELIRNNDAEHPFRQDSNFYYLTGFPEPDAIAVLLPGHRKTPYLLFCRDKDPLMETWTGRRYGQKGAKKIFQADEAYSIDEIDDIIGDLLLDKDKIYYCAGQHGDFSTLVQEWLKPVKRKVRAGFSAPSEFAELEPLIHEMRLFKSPAEQDMMRHAAEISADAHIQAMLCSETGQTEYGLEAEIIYEFRRRNSVPAYTTIVGAGKNGCILHYTQNSEIIKKNQLVLIDAGAEFGNYAADITRTFPADGQFSDAQKALYNVVLKAQLAAIDMVRPGKRWNDAHDAAVKALTQGLVKLGLLKGRVAKLIKEEAYKRFYMHRTGHWLGMDVHDVGDYKVADKWRKLEPGMVLTVEPGLYISSEHKDVDKQWHNIGIRIEDDVLVTTSGNEVLTDKVPKTVKDIEDLMANDNS